ncbi:MAG: prepilin-type N-terminal cleavage/methylation domain-containing protein [Phycisphaerales bacterium]
MSSRNKRFVRRAKARGFTLIEAAMAVIIIGVGVLAMVDAQQAFVRANLWSSHAASATFLANEIREYTRHLPKHDPVASIVIDGGSPGAGTLYGWGPNIGEVDVSDFDDLDDFDGISFSYIGNAGFDDGDLPGPIDAFGNVIPEITIAGQEMMTTDNQDLPMQGWTQTVIVEKVEPFDTATVVPDWEDRSSTGGPAVDAFPLRVSVEVYYQGINDIEGELITTVSWVVP